MGKPTSPFTYISNVQRTELLHRSAPLACVVQRKGSKIIRIFAINCGLFNNEGYMVGYLMGLYKYKCNSNPIWSDVYDIETKSIVVYHHISDLKGFKCDINCLPTEAAVFAHNEYYESKRWFEHGVYDDRGIMKDNRIITFNEVRASTPSTDEPGLLAICVIICTTMQTTSSHIIVFHRLHTLVRKSRFRANCTKAKGSGGNGRSEAA